jgi:hypothetical protein
MQSLKGTSLKVYLDSYKSTSRYSFMMADGVISWKSVKQTLIVTSNIKVAFVFSFKATAHSVWLKSFHI